MGLQRLGRLSPRIGGKVQGTADRLQCDGHGQNAGGKVEGRGNAQGMTRVRCRQVEDRADECGVKAEIHAGVEQHDCWQAGRLAETRECRLCCTTRHDRHSRYGRHFGYEERHEEQGEANGNQQWASGAFSGLKARIIRRVRHDVATADEVRRASFILLGPVACVYRAARVK